MVPAIIAAAVTVFIAQFVFACTLARLIPVIPFAFHVTATVGDWHRALMSYGLTAKLRLDIFSLDRSRIREHLLRRRFLPCARPHL